MHDNRNYDIMFISITSLCAGGLKKLGRSTAYEQSTRITNNKKITLIHYNTA